MTRRHSGFPVDEVDVDLEGDTANARLNQVCYADAACDV